MNEQKGKEVALLVTAGDAPHLARAHDASCRAPPVLGGCLRTGGGRPRGRTSRRERVTSAWLPDAGGRVGSFLTCGGPTSVLSVSE